jgi:hypothetical protein
MSTIGTYLMTAKSGGAKLDPADGAGPILDAIQFSGPSGADVGTLAQQTTFDAKFVEIVLQDLTNNGLAELKSDQRYHLTDFGIKARYLVAR